MEQRKTRNIGKSGIFRIIVLQSIAKIKWIGKLLQERERDVCVWYICIAKIER